MQTQFMPVNQPEKMFNSERDLVRQLLETRVKTKNDKIQLCNNNIKILGEMYHDYLDEKTGQVIAGRPQPESKIGKNQITPEKKLESKATEQLNTLNPVKSLYTQLDQTIETIAKPMRELLDCKIDEDLRILNSEYSKLSQLELEKKANDALAKLTTLAQGYKNNAEVDQAIAEVNAHVIILANTSKILMDTFNRLKNVCSLREKVKQPGFNIESITQEDIKSGAIFCSKLRDEFLSLRGIQLNGFVAAWQGKIDAVKKTAATVTRARADLLTKLKTLNTTAPAEAKAANNPKSAVMVR